MDALEAFDVVVRSSRHAVHEIVRAGWSAIAVLPWLSTAPIADELAGAVADCLACGEVVTRDTAALGCPMRAVIAPVGPDECLVGIVLLDEPAADAEAWLEHALDHVPDALAALGHDGSVHASRAFRTALGGDRPDRDDVARWLDGWRRERALSVELADGAAVAVEVDDLVVDGRPWGVALRIPPDRLLGSGALASPGPVGAEPAPVAPTPRDVLRRRADEVATHGRLSPRERLVFDLLIEGWSNEMIARELGLSVRTVKFHVGNLLQKLGADSRARPAARAGLTRRFPEPTARPVVGRACAAGSPSRWSGWAGPPPPAWPRPTP